MAKKLTLKTKAKAAKPAVKIAPAKVVHKPKKVKEPEVPPYVSEAEEREKLRVQAELHKQHPPGAVGTPETLPHEQG